MTHLDNVFDLQNLRRAYRWLMSNSDGQYKSYFRDSYDAFAIASETHLQWIRREGIKGRYQVSHGSKVFIPKQSGLVRPITLLTVEDQIVYQACVNLTAGVLKNKTGSRYGRRVFAHLYAGKLSTFFYVRWQTCYRNFLREIRNAYREGYEYIADFDLTSFYDSIDHRVLAHFLGELAVDRDVITFLVECLMHWTSTTWAAAPTSIYHGHGIPQGPLSSGMLSEAVLLFLDEAGERGGGTIYLRYVDDIKILARTEVELRSKLMRLDLAAKAIGLFPQTSKINVHRIINPEDEIKSISWPPERATRRPGQQPKIVARLLRISADSTVRSADSTQFKILLAQAHPTHRLNARLMAVLRSHPELASPICSYIERYRSLPGKLAADIVDYVCDGPELYHSVSGALLSASLGRIGGPAGDTLARFSAERLFRPERGAVPPQPTYKEALVASCLSKSALSYAEYRALAVDEPDWWVQKRLLRMLSQHSFGTAAYAELLNAMLRVGRGEVSRIAAFRVLQDTVKLTRPYGDVEVTAKHTLKVAGVIKSASMPDSPINKVIAYVLNRDENAYQWKTLFGDSYRRAELVTIFLKRNYEANIDAFLVQLDSYCNLMTEEVWGMLKPGEMYPSYGRAVKDATLGTALPATMSTFLLLHDLRLQSTTAHPFAARTGKPIRRLKHKDFYSLLPSLIRAFDEFERVVKR